MPAAWDRTASGPSSCATTVRDCATVYNYLNGQSQNMSTYATSPIWGIVDGPWKLSTFNSDGHITFVPNKSYSGPVKPTLSRFAGHLGQVAGKQRASLVEVAGPGVRFDQVGNGRVIRVGDSPAHHEPPHPLVAIDRLLQPAAAEMRVALGSAGRGPAAAGGRLRRPVGRRPAHAEVNLRHGPVPPRSQR